jgi:hypothetical protein
LDSSNICILLVFEVLLEKGEAKDNDDNTVKKKKSFLNTINVSIFNPRYNKNSRKKKDAVGECWMPLSFFFSHRIFLPAINPVARILYQKRKVVDVHQKLD